MQPGNPQLWCYRWSCSKWYTGESALSSLDTFGEVTTVCGVWRVVKEELVQNVHLSIWPDFQAQRLGGKFCKLMDHSGSATVLWTPPVFTSNVSVTCVFMRASRLHCAIDWQSRPQSAFPIRLQFVPGGVLGSLESVNVLTALVRSILFIQINTQQFMLVGIQRHWHQMIFGVCRCYFCWLTLLLSTREWTVFEYKYRWQGLYSSTSGHLIYAKSKCVNGIWFNIDALIGVTTFCVIRPL